MKVKLTLSVDGELLQKAREILHRAPKKSVSSFLEEKLAELIKTAQQGKEPKCLD
ncbi:MAG: hypothetical protein KDE33_29575 [Bacteroidetes bacterium]|nr:hypothetical protein [Bacteroidota bacterium]